MVVENAFGRLKNEVEVLVQDIGLQAWTCSHYSGCICVTLHNMCETFSDPFMEEWQTEENAILLQ